jgi:hypothetical protein
MPLPTSGAISISQIRTELGTSSGSLRTLSSLAGKSTPDAMSEFYGYSNALPIGIDAYVPYSLGCYNYFTFSATTVSSQAVNTNLGVNIYWYGDLGGYIAGYLTISSGSYCGSVSVYTGGSINCIGENISNISWEVNPTSSGNQSYFPNTYYTDFFPCDIY